MGLCVVVDGLYEPTGDCNAGWYCTGGSYMAEPHTAGNATDLSECTCPLVNYTGGQCWPGTYCPTGAHYPLPCTPGQYCMQYGLSTPEGICDAGFYCNGSSSRPDPPDGICPMGYYCEAGSGSPTPCPAGTMSASYGNTNMTNCAPCTPGYYCAGPANINYTGPCYPGYYCPSGQTTSSPNEYNCSVGHFCPGASPQPEPCPSGKYQDEERQSSCKDCPAGR